MVYKEPQYIQKYNFSCVEELKCDIIENLLRLLGDDYEYLTIILDSSTARKLYTKFLQSNVNGFCFLLHEDYTNQEVTEMLTEDNTIMSVNNQGEILFDVYKTDLGGIGEDNNFVYLSETLADKWIKRFEKQKTECLVFSIS